ncbi:MAG: Na+/H+ antiporter NhaD-like permease [Acidobacteria bacterium]|nr:Na+/H+ antiporter NhaD-like permease [Acidobacteriota bacterium]
MRRLLQLVRKNAVTLAAALLALAFVATGRVTPLAAWRAIDLDLLLVLFALLVAVEMLRESGYLHLAVKTSVARFGNARAFTAALFLFSGLLAGLVTNDVALFIVIPFTVVACRFSDFHLENAIILEILASNLLGCLTPLGNPQNLFVFHRSGWSAVQFVATMLPFVAWSAAGLLLALFLLEPSRKMSHAQLTMPALDGRMALAGALPFILVLLEIARLVSALPAAIAALVMGGIFLRRRFVAIDLSIVPLFFCAFIVVEGLRAMHLYGVGTHPYLASIALSQLISNVPTTVLLSPLVDGDWRTLLYGVSAGSCGTIVASLANLLGWRIYERESGRDPRFFRRFTALSFVFLLWCGLGGWLLLQRF